MKLNVDDKIKQNKFTPITITMTVETEAELKQLWHRFNIGGGIFSDEYKNRYWLANTDLNGSGGVWQAIDDAMKLRGISPAGSLE